MAWIEDEARWQSEDTGFHPGRTLFWLATIIAAVMAIFVIADVLISWGQGAPTVRIIALVAAAIVWLVGCICRALFP